MEVGLWNWGFRASSPNSTIAQESKYCYLSAHGNGDHDCQSDKGDGDAVEDSVHAADNAASSDNDCHVVYAAAAAGADEGAMKVSMMKATMCRCCR